ncbi:hypothetical protein [Sphingomonas sp. ID0503]|uniref:hypothetical protein n=1 Tax=Sphingomonas sp. ID0503 TaxID=3399691 RepID=UPI003AFB1208
MFDDATMPKASPIHFRLDKGGNYALVQATIFGQVRAALGGTPCSEGFARRSDAFNFSLFIGTQADALMSHGVADKNYLLRSAKGRPLLHNFRHVFVPGRWSAERLQRSPGLDFRGGIHVVGWPRLDALIAMQNAVPQKDVGGRPKVLWAPTHDLGGFGGKGEGMSSFPAFERHLEALGEIAEVTVSLHPRNRRDKKPTQEKLVECDILISDTGTMVYEAWALGKPVIFPRWLLEDRVEQALMPETAERHIFDERIGLHPRSFDELADMVHARPALDQRTRDFLYSYLDPALLGRSSARIADLLRSLSCPGGAPKLTVA